MSQRQPSTAGPRFAFLGLILILLAAGPVGLTARPQNQPSSQSPAQAAPDDEKVWTDFLAWYKTAPFAQDVLGAYADQMALQKVPQAEIDRRVGLITRLFATRLEGIELFYDKTYGRPATGKPWEDGFASAPNELLIGAVKGLKPGLALDVGMGQGRNAVELARQGWTVTGFDLSTEAVAAAARNAKAAGVQITPLKGDYASFDFGREAWDLVVMTYAWAPVADPAFVEKVWSSLKPGGLVVFEHFLDTPERRYAPMIRALAPGTLQDYFSGFEILSYEETTGLGDWGGPGSRLVRMIARKR
jgi:2-polyprenyl-3-methyl-5-hydroxy-6-metoxy-1,4-benzoquinol methylase